MASGSAPRLSRSDLVLPVMVAAVLVAGLAYQSRRAVEPSSTTVSSVQAYQVTDPTASERCGTCHEAELTAWRASHHALAQTEERGRAVPASGESEQVVLGRIGVDPLRQWLLPVGAGQVQVSALAEDVATGERFDVFDDGRHAGEWGHWRGGGMTWNRSCAACHATEVRKGFRGPKGGYATTIGEVGVGCEACHGRSEGHPPAAPNGGGSVDTCAPCHSRRAELTDGWVPGAPLLDAFAPVLIDGDLLHYGDGQVRDEVFEWGAFATSRMAAAGVRCVDCHEPHSGGLVREGDALCLGCHDAMEGFERHDPLHEPTVGCVACHMPVTTYMQRHPRHDHGFRRPDPITGAALGIPDACHRCHERDVTEAFVATWGAGEVSARARALTSGSTDGLLAVLEDKEQAPMWRASAAARLSDPAGVAGLLEATRDGHPLVRYGAWAGLAPWLDGVEDVDEILSRGLRDPVRAVRVAAARAGAPRLARDGEEARAYRDYLDHNRDQPSALVEDASWALSRGHGAEAEALLREALALDPQRVSALDGLSVVLAGTGRVGEAVSALERAVALAPDDGELWMRLGLARAGEGDAMGAEAAMARAVDLDVPRARYNLGLLLAERGAHAEALRELFAAEDRADDPDVRYAIASVLWRWGRPDEARIAAKRVLQLDPDHEGARALLSSSGPTGRPPR